MSTKVKSTKVRKQKRSKTVDKRIAALAKARAAKARYAKQRAKAPKEETEKAPKARQEFPKELRARYNFDAKLDAIMERLDALEGAPTETEGAEKENTEAHGTVIRRGADAKERGRAAIEKRVFTVSVGNGRKHTVSVEVLLISDVSIYDDDVFSHLSDSAKEQAEATLDASIAEYLGFDEMHDVTELD